MRRSVRETLSSRRSERLKSQTPASSSDKKVPNPLRRSERIEKNGSSSSSGSKKSCSISSLGMEKESRKEEYRKIAAIYNKEQSKDNKMDTKSDGLSESRKRLDARTYRSLLQPQVKATKNSGANDSKELREARNDCTKRNKREMKNSDGRCKEAQRSSFESEDIAGFAIGNDRERKKCKLASIEANKSKDWKNLMVLKCTDNSLRSSPPAASYKENGGDGSEREIDNSEGERSIGFSTKGYFAADFESDISLKPLEREISSGETYIAHDTCSSPSGIKNKSSEGCIFCGKLQRAHHNSQTEEMCVCDADKSDDLSISAFEEPCKPSKSGDSCSYSSFVKCSKDDQNKRNSPADTSKNCLVVSSSTAMEEDTGRPTYGGASGSAEEDTCSLSAAIQTDAVPSACLVCKNPGMLLCCDGKGCKRSYHLCCLDPPLNYIPPGAWLCPFCVKKMMMLGVYSVSEGIESVLDLKEGTEDGKLYLVKYKSLAHVHNCWIPENQMLLEAPMLLAKFNRRRQKKKVVRWKQEWTEPHRLLQKRFLMSLEIAHEYVSRGDNNNSYCSCQWFVKWKGLGYEHATWELENSPALCSSNAILLVKDYEDRHRTAKKLSDPSRTAKALQVKDSPIHRLSRFPEGFPPELDDDHLDSINRLLEFWHSSHNAVVIDDQERIIKTILFILALESHVCRPFLIISSTTSISLWETELACLAPSINAVVYCGNKDVRKVIQAVEFYEEDGCIMFQVLLSHPDAVFEDFEALDCIGWEAVIVDECQNSRVSKCFGSLKHLTADFRLLLLGSQLKDNLAECLNLLAFLDSGVNENCVHNLKFNPKDTAGNLAILKDRLACYIAYERKPDSSKFFEYWVPIQLSNVQLEQYCSTLLSNMTALHSCPKTDQVGALQNILISTRKCCDHPYVADPLLQSSLTKGLRESEYLDIGINASAKLLLLDKVLHEVKEQGLRVLILFQSIGGAGRNSTGDILDDFLLQRFGVNSYERLDGGLVKQKKVAVLSMFNDKSRARFIFLIENRACHPTVKLSSVDAVIIFNSDWNPLNDLRVLQKINIESQYKQIKVFRLYSAFTIEEKILVFAKQDMTLDSNIQHISPSVSHSLLSWGASYLFSKLDEFHQHGKPSNSSETLTGKVDDTVLEFINQLLNKAEGSQLSNCSVLSKAQQSGASYSRSIILLGEKEKISSCDKDAPVFWSNLLKGRCPQWMYITQSSQRIRRKVRSFNEFLMLPESENDEGKKKRRKVISESVGLISLRLQDKEVVDTRSNAIPTSLPLHCSSLLFNVSQRDTPGVPSSMANKKELLQSQGNSLQVVPNSSGIITGDILRMIPPFIAEYEGWDKLNNAQRNLHLLLKMELSELCETLRLPGDVIIMAELFLQYIMDNHTVNHEPESTLQAFKISLCWRAAACLNFKVDHKGSLALAKKCLKFECDEEQAYSVYSELRILKRKFSHKTDGLRNENELKYQSSTSTSSRGVPKDHVFCLNSTLTEFGHQIYDGNITEKPVSLQTVDKQLVREPESVLKTPARCNESTVPLEDELLKKQFDIIENVCSRREEDLTLRQQVELSDFNAQRDEEMMKLEKAYDSDLEQIQSVYFDSAVRNDKIKSLSQEFTKKMTSLDHHMKFQRRKLALMQADARNKERQIKDQWLDEAKAGKVEEFFDKVPLADSGFTLEVFGASGHTEAFVSSQNAIHVSGPSSDQAYNNSAMVNSVDSNNSNTKFSGIPITVTNSGAGNTPLDTGSLCSNCNARNGMEYFDLAETSREIHETVSTELAHDMTIGNEYHATTLSRIADSANDQMEGSVIETDAPASQSNMRELEPIQLSIGIIGNAAAVSPETTGVFSIQTESPDLTSDIVNVCSMNDAVHGCSVMAAGNGSIKHTSIDTSDGELHDQMQYSSLADASANYDCDIYSLSNQVGQSDQLVLHSNVQTLPLHATTLERTHTENLRNSPPTDTSMKQQIDAAASQAEHSNPLVNQSDVHLFQLSTSTQERTGSEEQLITSLKTSSSSQQAEVLQQPTTTTVHILNNMLERSAVHSILPSFMTSPGRTLSEDIGNLSTQQYSGSRVLQFLPMASLMPLEGLQHDPLENELTKIRRQQELCDKMQEDKKLRLKLECDLEIEKVRKKYDALQQKADSEFLHGKNNRDIIYNKILMNQALAQQFRTQFIEKRRTSVHAQGSRSSYVQPQVVQRSPSVSSAALPNPVTLASSSAPAPATVSALASSRPHLPVSAVSSVHSSQVTHKVLPIALSSNSARPNFSAILPPIASLRVGTEPRARSPAPHLHFRPPTAASTQNIPQQAGGLTNQERPHASSGSRSSISQQMLGNPTMEPTCTTRIT